MQNIQRRSYQVRTGILIGIIFVFLSPGPLSAQERGLENRVEELYYVPSPTGYESPMAAAIMKIFADNAMWDRDNLGSLYLGKGEGEARIAVITGMDEIGYVVSGISSDGFLNIYRGVYAPHPLFDVYQFGHPLTIWTRNGPISGVLALPSSHTLSQERRRNLMSELTLEHAFVDVGARSREEVSDRRIAYLDPVTPVSPLFPLAGGKLSGNALGTKVCTALVVEAVKRAFGQDRGEAAVFAWLAQTKQLTRVNGTRVPLGSLRAQKSLNADKVLIVDSFTTGTADATGFEVGGGPVLIGGSYDSTLRKTIEEAAADKGIRLRSGTEFTAPMISAFAGRDAVGLLLPVKFPYTQAEVISLQDAEALQTLVEAVLQVDSPPVRRNGNPVVREAAQKSGMSAWVMLQKLALLPGVSEHEAGVADAVQAMLPDGIDVQRDEMHNVWFTVGQGDPHLVFVAHTDELGLVVTGITEAGRLKVIGKGGFLAQSYEGRPVVVYTQEGEVYGVVEPRADYADREASQALLALKDIEVYLGVDSAAEVAELGVAEGDFITIRKSITELTPDILAMRAVDDRAGCAVLLDAAYRIDWSSLKGKTVTFAWDVQEETGLVGAGVLAKQLEADYVFPVDTFVSSDAPRDDKWFARVPLGEGLVLRGMDSSVIVPRAELEKIADIADRHGIPYQYGNTRGSTDGTRFVPEGSVCVPLSWPGNYSHSFIEKIHRKDLDALVRMVVAIVRDLD